LSNIKKLTTEIIDLFSNDKNFPALKNLNLTHTCLTKEDIQRFKNIRSRVIVLGPDPVYRKEIVRKKM